jgi:RNA polymerase sigma-70 factor (ECF subfamily)
MQNVFHALTSRLAQFERRNANDSFRGWLYTVTKNKIRDHFRAGQNKAQALGGTDAHEMWQHLPDAPASEQSAEGNAEISGVRQRALELISGGFESQTWQAFMRTTVNGDSPKDVANDLGISVWAVYKARSRVLSKLRTEFADLLS